MSICLCRGKKREPSIAVCVLAVPPARARSCAAVQGLPVLQLRSSSRAPALQAASEEENACGRGGTEKLVLVQEHEQGVQGAEGPNRSQRSRRRPERRMLGLAGAMKCGVWGGGGRMQKAEGTHQRRPRIRLGR